MATLIEKIDSRAYEIDGEDNIIGITRNYKLMDVSSDTTAKTYANSLSKTYNDLVLNSLSVNPVWVDTENTRGEWEITARYVAEEEAERRTNEESVEVDGSGSETYILTQSLHTTSYAPTGETAPDFDSAINVTSEGVAGVELEANVKTYIRKTYVPDATVDSTYLQTRDDMEKHTNDASVTLYTKRYDETDTLQSVAVRTFAEEELLFDHYSRRFRPEKNDWEFTYVFKYSPTKTDISVGTNITVTEKKGWHYLWVFYETKKNGTGGFASKVPVAAYVEKVYDTADFSSI